MNTKILQLISNELIQKKLVSESNIETILVNTNLTAEKTIESVINELDNLKNYSLMLSFWEEFVKSNITIPEEQDNNKQ